MASSVISGGGVGVGGGKGRGGFQRRNGTNFNNVLFPWKGNILLGRNMCGRGMKFLRQFQAVQE